MRDLRVLTGPQAAARDLATIAAGTPSFELMRRAGDCAAQLVLDRFPDVSRGARVYTGAGNNGGDGWVVAASLREAGVRVEVREIVPASTEDARRARERVTPGEPLASPGVIVDALLGTGVTGSPRPAVADAIREIGALRSAGATVIALDLPSGLDASTGFADIVVAADCTISFGHWKRGLLRRRDLCGVAILVDIGLGDAPEDGAPLAMTAARALAWTPAIDPLGHKGSRRRLMIAGAAPGFAGASVLAGRAALRSGVGMVRYLAHAASLSALQSACPEAVAIPWPERWGTIDASWADALLVGPGFGVSAGAREQLEGLFTWWQGPLVIDADVFSLFAADRVSLARAVRGRPVIATPHASEAARMLDVNAAVVSADPEATASALASELDCCVLLKGVPTWICAPGVPSIVVPRGTPALATGGSGDALAGIVATLLAQGVSPSRAAAVGAFVHGRAAELVTQGRTSRGVALEDVIGALSRVWGESPTAIGPAFVLDELPDVREPRHV